MIRIKKPEEVAQMRELGRITAQIMQRIGDFIKAGISTADLNDYINKVSAEFGVKPAFLGCYGFPASACISVNEELIHGIPSQELVLKDGDIVSVDYGAKSRGWFSDMAMTFAVGEIDPLKKKLMSVGEQALEHAIAAVKADATIGDVGHAVQSFVEAEGFCVVKKFVGHGIGKELHEEPEIPNFGVAGEGEVLKPGMTLAIEPMVTVDSDDVFIADDGWTVISKDGKACVHFEHTVVVTENGAEILTV